MKVISSSEIARVAMVVAYGWDIVAVDLCLCRCTGKIFVEGTGRVGSAREAVRLVKTDMEMGCRYC